MTLIATWNVNSLKARLPRVEEWLTAVQPDVLCMQETKMTNEQFPSEVFDAMGYESAHHGYGRWNGVAILSKVGLDDVEIDFDDGGDADPDSRIVWATCAGIRVASVYVPNGREVGHDHYHYKLDWLGRLKAHLDRRHTPDDRIVIAGDWNVTRDDCDVWDPEFFEGMTHVTQPERDAITALVDWGLVDTFRERYTDEGLFSFWDYRNGDFHKRRGMRIDYLLASTALAPSSRSDLIDRNARKGTKPSDHAPVLSLYVD